MAVSYSLSLVADPAHVKRRHQKYLLLLFVCCLLLARGERKTKAKFLLHDNKTTTIVMMMMTMISALQRQGVVVIDGTRRNAWNLGLLGILRRRRRHDKEQQQQQQKQQQPKQQHEQQRFIHCYSISRPQELLLQQCGRGRFIQCFSTTSTTIQKNKKNKNTNTSTFSIGNVTVNQTPLGSGRDDLIPRLPSLTTTMTTTTTNDNDHDDNTLFLQSLSSSRESLSHLRWMLQKDLVLHQDFCLLGPPHLARDRRMLVLLYAALTNREVEYLTLSRETSDADLKQRKEVVGSITSSTTSSTNSVYIDQAPVRAAIHGRLLILDGLEKAERNVLPTLNNLLENRELSLEDGSLLVAPHVYDDNLQQQHQQHYHSSITSNTTILGNGKKKIRRVHPDFLVAALGTMQDEATTTTTTTNTLDPPLRSRFQARYCPELSPGTILESLNILLEGQLDMNRLQDLVQQHAVSVQQPESTTITTTTTKPTASSSSMVGIVPNRLSLASLSHASRYLLQYPSILSVQSTLDAHGRGLVRAHNVLDMNALPCTQQTNKQPSNQHMISSSSSSSSSLSLGQFVPTTTTQTIQRLLEIVLLLESQPLVVGTQGSQEGGQEEGQQKQQPNRHRKSICRSICLVGPKGCGKSALIRHMVTSSSSSSSSSNNNNTTIVVEWFPLHTDLSARDLLCRRGTDFSTGNSVWYDTPLTRAAKQGLWVVLDGLDKLDNHALSSLALLLEQGWIDLPSDEAMTVTGDAITMSSTGDGDGGSGSESSSSRSAGPRRLYAQPGFAVLALAHPPPSSSSSSNTAKGTKSHKKKNWMTPEVTNMMNHWIALDPLPHAELQQILSHLYPDLNSSK